MDLKGQMENIQPRGGVVVTMVTDLVVTVTMVMVEEVVVVTMVMVVVTAAMELPPGLTALTTAVKVMLVAFIAMEMLSCILRSPKHGQQ